MLPCVGQRYRVQRSKTEFLALAVPTEDKGPALCAARVDTQIEASAVGMQPGLVGSGNGTR